MGDYIDRHEALKDSYNIAVDGGTVEVVQVETLVGLPSADVKPVRRGHWEKIGDKTWWGLYECSECHLICSIDYDYCPHCGAKMKMNP